MKSLPPRPVSLAMQLLQLRRRFQDGQGSIARSRLTWDQWIQPHALAHRYRCRLEHKLREYPTVVCMEPALSALADGRKLPHVYTHAEPICMCLFMRRRECWDDGMSLANVVMPLAFFWLAHFEEWLYSGVWRGGGTHDIVPEAPVTIPIFPSELAL